MRILKWSYFSSRECLRVPIQMLAVLGLQKDDFKISFTRHLKYFFIFHVWYKIYLFIGSSLNLIYFSLFSFAYSILLLALLPTEISGNNIFRKKLYFPSTAKNSILQSEYLSKCSELPLLLPWPSTSLQILYNRKMWEFPGFLFSQAQYFKVLEIITILKSPFMANSGYRILSRKKSKPSI